ncbi:MAG: Mut7-C RNAse domain-containing protein [Natronomonas sp.]
MSDGDSTRTIQPETDRLLCDLMLGKLAVYLRLCGYDTAYAGNREIEADDRIAAITRREDRRLCTRDVELARRVSGAILLTEREVEAQLAELREAGVELEVADPPPYCGRCNGKLVAVAPNDDTPKYAPDPGETDCWRCRACGQVFWKGSHYERMAATIESV